MTQNANVSAHMSSLAKRPERWFYPTLGLLTETEQEGMGMPPFLVCFSRRRGGWLSIVYLASGGAMRPAAILCGSWAEVFGAVACARRLTRNDVRNRDRRCSSPRAHKRKLPEEKVVERHSVLMVKEHDDGSELVPSHVSATASSPSDMAGAGKPGGAA